MERRSEEEFAISRRSLLSGSGSVLCAVFLASWLLPAGHAFADDGEGESDGGGESGGGDSGESDSGESDSGGGDSEGGDHGGADHGGDDDGGADGGDDSDGFDGGSLDQSDAARAVQLGEAMPLKSALQRVEKSYGGSVIDVRLRSTGKRLEYRFKIITERGSVRSIRMDAKSGRFLGLGALFR